MLESMNTGGESRKETVQVVEGENEYTATLQ